MSLTFGNDHHFQVVMSINNILECVQQLECDMKVSMLSVGDKVTVLLMLLRFIACIQSGTQCKILVRGS